VSTARFRWGLVPPALIVLVCAAVVVRKAWVCDDAYITFRTIDNFTHGLGLTWNPDERVQSYSHPLWMLLVSAFYAVTGEPFYTSIALGVALSLATLILTWRAAAGPALASLALALFAASSAFTDYSTSGLENPLTHLLLALFLWGFLREGELEPRRLALLSLLAALLGANRIDALVLILPALAAAAWRTARAHGVGRTIRAIALGSLPLVAWELFSLVYYGFPFPNSAYAKLNNGFGRWELAARGLEYFRHSAVHDPLTLLTIGLGSTATLLASRGRGRVAAVACGVAFYLLCVVSVGGDFMTGRFFTAPLVAAIALASRAPLRPWAAWAMVAMVLCARLFLPAYSPLFHPVASSRESDEALDDTGISDERAYYGPIASLRQAPPGGPWPAPGAAKKMADVGSWWTSDVWLPGLKRLGLVDENETWPPTLLRSVPGDPIRPVIVRAAVGFVGFYGGPSLHIIDLHGLGDPLLARMPALHRDPLLALFTPRLTPRGWRVGHYVRKVPAGYLETLMTGTNRIRDPRLAAFYDRLSLVIHGPLLDPRRLRAIWDLNSGRLDPLLRPAS
jgi:arabinofuranosyltransferase